MKLEALDCVEIKQGEYGSSNFQKEMMAVSKIEAVEITLERVRDHNPLIDVSLAIEHVHLTPKCPVESTGVVKIDDEEISDLLIKSYNGKYLNSGEILLMQLFDGNLIIKATVINVVGKISS